jgi:glucosamine--fructose-6-phosphate aminotransferase (isomerizing)
MCGIVGYIGKKRAQNILVNGLKRLEYRGYDSAGIVTLTSKGKPTLLRVPGKVAFLEEKVRNHATDDTIGIGHTRWATHGVPSKANAHPHCVGSISLVHNGIIENYQDVKSMLRGHDYDFKSDTDSEVLATLIEFIYQQSAEKSLLNAVASALKMVTGAYGIAVTTSDKPDEIIIARKGSPLVVGIGDDETYIASDASALVGHTKTILYLKDGEIGRCSQSGIELYNVDIQPQDVVMEKLELDLSSIQKKGYDHFLLKEIHEQPDSLRATLRGRIDDNTRKVHLGGLNLTPAELKSAKNILIVGCGTSYYAGLLASYFIEQFVGDVTIQVEIASELRYRSFHVPEHTVALIVSQSGETADTLGCLQELKQRNIRTVGIINTVGSTISREVDGGIYLHAGAEISVASTKAFTSQVAAMLLFGLSLAESKGSNPRLVREYIDELVQLPAEIEKTVSAHEKEIKQLTQFYQKYDRALFIGRDTSYPVALEGALKLKEVSYIQAEAHPAGELKHGPIALIDDSVFEVFFLQDNWLYEKSQSNLIEMNARKAHTLVVTDTQKAIDAEHSLRIKTKLKLLTPLVFNTVSQLFAYYMAAGRGLDVDQPRNLAKSVTVE